MAIWDGMEHMVMNVFQDIKKAIDSSPRNDYTAELHLQIIKYADALKDVTGKEFCEKLDISSSYGVEFCKMKKISERLVQAGLNTQQI